VGSVTLTVNYATLRGLLLGHAQTSPVLRGRQQQTIQDLADQPPTATINNGVRKTATVGKSPQSSSAQIVPAYNYAALRGIETSCSCAPPSPKPKTVYQELMTLPCHPRQEEFWPPDGKRGH